MFVRMTIGETINKHVETGIPTLKMLQEAVGGYIEPAYEIPSNTRPQIGIVCYVNEEGFLFSDNPFVRHRLPELGASLLAGPAVWVGLNHSNGETAELTREEVDWVLDKVELEDTGLTT